MPSLSSAPEACCVVCWLLKGPRLMLDTSHELLTLIFHDWVLRDSRLYTFHRQPVSLPLHAGRLLQTLAWYRRCFQIRRKVNFVVLKVVYLLRIRARCSWDGQSLERRLSERPGRLKNWLMLETFVASLTSTFNASIANVKSSGSSVRLLPCTMNFLASCRMRCIRYSTSPASASAAPAPRESMERDSATSCC